jgi:hypothetical protein
MNTTACIRRRFFGGEEHLTLLEAEKIIHERYAREVGTDYDLASTFLRTPTMTVILGDTDSSDYENVSEFLLMGDGTASDEAIATFQAQVAEASTVDALRDTVAEAREEDLLALDQKIRSTLRSHNMNEALATVVAVANFFGINEHCNRAA